MSKRTAVCAGVCAGVGAVAVVADWALDRAVRGLEVGDLCDVLLVFRVLLLGPVMPLMADDGALSVAAKLLLAGYYAVSTFAGVALWRRAASRRALILGAGGLLVVLFAGQAVAMHTLMAALACERAPVVDLRLPAAEGHGS